jgi:hypothetical protein
VIALSGLGGLCGRRAFGAFAASAAFAVIALSGLGGLCGRRAFGAFAASAFNVLLTVRAPALRAVTYS